MQVTVIADPRFSHQQEHQKAMVSGLNAIGIDAVMRANANGLHGKTVACWGWRKGKDLRARGCNVIVMERGYLGDRFNWTSLAWNGLNGRGTFPNGKDAERFNQHFTLAPWKTGGDYVLVMGQVSGDASLQGKNLTTWYQQATEVGATAYGLPVHFRPHPMALRYGNINCPAGAKLSTGDLNQALEGAAVVITYNSNSAVDAVIAGVPAVATDQGSMSWDVVGHKFGDLVKPDRTQWANELAWRQWQIEEIQSGQALQGLFEGI